MNLEPQIPSQHEVNVKCMKIKNADLNICNFMTTVDVQVLVKIM